MHLNQADPVALRLRLSACRGRRPGILQRLDFAPLVAAHEKNGVHDERRLGSRLRDLAQHRIEQERHVVVDHGDDRQRHAVELQPLRGDKALAPLAALQGERCKPDGIGQGFGRIAVDVFGRGTRRHQASEGGEHGRAASGGQRAGVGGGCRAG